MLRVSVQRRGEVNQAVTPQTIHEPYWSTDLDVTPIGKTDKQIYWALSYRPRTPENILHDIRAALKGLQGEEGNASSTASSSSPGPQAFEATEKPAPAATEAERAIARLVLVFFVDRSRRAVPAVLVNAGSRTLIVTTGPAVIIPDGTEPAIDRAFLEFPGRPDVKAEFHARRHQGAVRL